MAEKSRVRTAIRALPALFLIVSMAGCIAVSRNVRQTGPTSGVGEVVTAGGQWEIDQAWQCQLPPRFELARERGEFVAASAGWLDEGWELVDFEVVSLPDGNGSPEQVCLVGTFRRWVVMDP
jgi:hypothetical protein